MRTGLSAPLYVLSDHLNTPRRLLNPANNSIIWQWNGEPFGADQASGSVTYNLRFPGQYYDAETGKHYNYFRDYDPAIGRYIESDPIGLAGGMNTYGYVGGNPVTITDHNGLEPQCGRYSRPCGKCTLIYDSDQHKGPHTHWNCPGQPQGSVRKDGSLCDGSLPPPPEVLKCLKQWGRIPNSFPASAETCGSGCQSLILGGLCLAACVLAPEVCIPAAVLGGAAAR